MENADIISWVAELEKVGLSVLLLVATVYALVQFSKWIAPRIDLWFNSYFDIMTARSKVLEDASNACKEIQTANLIAIKELTSVIKSLEEHILK